MLALFIDKIITSPTKVKYTLSILQIYWKYTSKVYLNYTSSILDVYFKYSSSCLKYTSSILQPVELQKKKYIYFKSILS